MNKLAIFFYFLYFNISLIAQNLVKNPGFEQITHEMNISPCTYCSRGEYFNSAVIAWKSYRGLTPDILTYDSSKVNCFPVMPHSGKRMAGIITYHPFMDSGYDFDYHEFLQGELNKPLQINKTYTFECWIYSDDSLAKRHLTKVLGERATSIIPVLCNNFGIQFSETKLETEGLPWRNFLTPKNNTIVYSKILNTNGKWKKIQLQFTAYKPYRFFYIGNFFEDKHTLTTLSPERTLYIDSMNVMLPKIRKDKGIFWERKKRIAYYCLDDISIREGDFIEKEIEEFKSNVSYDFQSIVFETGKATLIEASCAELDALIAFLQKHLKQKIIIIGHTDNVGNDNFNKSLSKQRAEIVRNYLVKKGLSFALIQCEGKGSDQPKADNNTEIGRQQNRRVEIRLVD